jgi:hypothetical protein
MNMLALRDREPHEDDRQVQDSEVALMDTIKAILEILMAAQIVSVDTIEMMLITQRAKYVPWRTPDAAVAIDLLLTFLRDPRRRESRERLRSVLQESARPPATGPCNAIGSWR